MANKTWFRCECADPKGRFILVYVMTDDRGRARRAARKHFPTLKVGSCYETPTLVRGTDTAGVKWLDSDA